VRAIEVHTPIIFTSFKRNEVNSRVHTPSAAQVAGRDAFEPYFADEDRAQRNTLALRDVDYVVRAIFVMTERAGPEDNLSKFVEMFRRRLEKGQCHYMPYLGCREFAASVEAAPPDRAPEEEDGTKRGGKKKLWNCGQVRGPVQLTFARSIDPIVALEHSITRVALTNTSDTDRSSVDPESGEEKAGSGQMGRKSTIPYGLYRAHGFVSPQLAADTRFSDADLTLLWQALKNMFESDRSAARGLMSARHLIVFKHESPLGDAPAHRLFERVVVTRKKTPARQFADYEVLLDGKALTASELHKEVAAKL
jgi:hypothetical protein